MPTGRQRLAGPRGRLAAPDADTWALVTGATSGIGEAWARELARRGYRLILTGRRMDVLEAAADTIRRDIGRERVEVHRAELSDPAAVQGIVDACRGRVVDVLVNNAGFGVGKTFLADELDRELAMESVHVAAPMRLMHVLIPEMVRRGRGWVVNVSSLASFFPLPTSAAYSASKASLRYLTESLSMELRGSGVRFQALCPGFTRTHFHADLPMPERVMRNGLFTRWMSSDAVVHASIRALERARVVCVPGFWNRVLRRVGSLVPRRLYYAVASSVSRPEGAADSPDPPART